MTNDCPFCQRLVDGDYFMCEQPGVARFEPLNPVTPGHMLFIPTTHYTHLKRAMGREVTTALGRCMTEAAIWGHNKTTPKGPEQFNLITSFGPAATQTIDHIHIHYVPRRHDDGLHLPWTGQIKEH